MSAFSAPYMSKDEMRSFSHQVRMKRKSIADATSSALVSSLFLLPLHQGGSYLSEKLTTLLPNLPPIAASATSVVSFGFLALAGLHTAYHAAKAVLAKRKITRLVNEHRNEIACYRRNRDIAMRQQNRGAAPI